MDITEAFGGSAELVDSNGEGQILIILNGCRSGCIKSAKYLESFGNLINTQDYFAVSSTPNAEDIINWIMEQMS